MNEIPAGNDNDDNHKNHKNEWCDDGNSIVYNPSGDKI